MTRERYEKLSGLGFRWSTSIAKKGSGRKPASSAAEPPADGAAPSDDAAAAADASNDIKEEDSAAAEKAVEEAVAVAAIEIGEGAVTDGGTDLKQEEEEGGDGRAVIQV